MRQIRQPKNYIWLTNRRLFFCWQKTQGFDGGLQFFPVPAADATGEGDEGGECEHGVERKPARGDWRECAPL